MKDIAWVGPVGGGAATGSLLWLAVAGSGLEAQADEMSQRLARASPPPLQYRVAAPTSIGAVVSNPIFVLTTGPGAATEATIRLDGISRSPARTAALLAFGDKPAAWLALGATRDGVTLTEVSATEVILDTPTGFRTLKIGETGAPAAARQVQPPQPGPPAPN